MSIAWILNQQYGTSYYDCDISDIQKGDKFAEIEYCIEHWVALEDAHIDPEQPADRPYGDRWVVEAQCIEDGRIIQFAQTGHSSGLNLFGYDHNEQEIKAEL